MMWWRTLLLFLSAIAVGNCYSGPGEEAEPTPPSPAPVSASANYRMTRAQAGPTADVVHSATYDALAMTGSVFSAARASSAAYAVHHPMSKTVPATPTASAPASAVSPSGTIQLTGGGCGLSHLP
ncbi:MAG: hypothetical protein HYV03_05420 [Deltaproteobacteria bacterium]|nr:hypothetical protein [Deltaproteobacteria bacterium]